MSTRFSLANQFFKLSHAQFVAITCEFKLACEASFAAPCTLAISLYTQPLVFTTYVDEEIEENLAMINKPHWLLDTPDLGAVSPHLWKCAGYVKVGLYPTETALAPSSAFAHVEFKGLLPAQATFYVQPGGAEVQVRLERQFGRMVRGDGYAHHGRRSAARPVGAIGW
jgi:hypothetical protein